MAGREPAPQCQLADDKKRSSAPLLSLKKACACSAVLFFGRSSPAPSWASFSFTFVLFVQRSGSLFEFLVRNSGSPRQVAYLFALVLPQVLPFTIPLGVLVGTLLTLSRMSTDGEITAMRAAGVPSRRVVPPILTFGFLAMLVAAAASLWLTPWSIRERYRVQNQLIASQLTADVQPRVFAEQFPNSILYVS